MNKEYEQMFSGDLYLPGDDEIMSDQANCLEIMYDFNATRPHQQEQRQALMKKMFAEIGDNCYIEPPLHSNWGGAHCHLGNDVYANFNLTLVDDGHIYIGDHTMLAPNVIIATAAHPIIPGLREKKYQFNTDVHIGRNCWLGAGVIVLPGITIGDNSVIGAGSVVTHDVPANCVAVGNPCRVLREISDYDKEYFAKNKKINPDLFD